MNRLRSPDPRAPCVERRTCGAAQKRRGGCAAEKRMGGWEHFPLGKKRLRPSGAKPSWAARCAESLVLRPAAGIFRPRAVRGMILRPRRNVFRKSKKKKAPFRALFLHFFKKFRG